MMDPRVGLDLFSAIKASAEGVARILRHDPSSAVLFWGEPPEVEVVHQRGVPEDVCRALTTRGGRAVAEAIRHAGRPIRVVGELLDERSRELRMALRSHGIESLATFPLLGESGVVGCLVVPLDSGTVVDTPDEEAWRLACRALEGLQFLASTAALRGVLAERDVARPKAYEGLLVVDRWERVVLADGVFTTVPGWSREDPFGRALNTLPGGALISALEVSESRPLRWREHLLPPVAGHGVPVALAALPFGMADGASEGGRIVLLRDLRAATDTEDDTTGLLALAMRVAHASDELSVAIPGHGDGPAGLDASLVERLRDQIAEGRELVGRVLDECLGGDRNRVDLNELVQQLLDRYATDMEAERIRVFRFKGPDLPVVRADRLVLLQALRALILTARESLHPHGGSLTIRTWSEDGWVHAVVSDDGVGQPGAEGGRAFEPLFALPADPNRAVSVEEARGLLEAQGGFLTVESRPRLWTRLEVRLPVAPAAQPAAPAGPPPAIQLTAGKPGVMEVLVVDDNAALRSVLKRYLERRGHRVTEATDGEDALRIVADRSFDRVIVDIQMPVKDGPTFYLDLAQVAPGLRDRTIFMTGGFVQMDVERFIEDSGRPAIKKPFDLAKVMQTIEG
ncbi:MAG: response regulator [Longimicrobiales bacterium]